LQFVERLYHVGAGAEVVEAGIGKRYHCCREISHLRIFFNGVGAEAERPVSIEIVCIRHGVGKGLLAGIPSGFFHQAIHRLFAKQPDANINQKGIISRLFAYGVGRGFLQESDQLFRLVAIAEHNAEVLRLFRFYPKAEENHVGIRYGWKLPFEPDEHIAARNHYSGVVRCSLRQSLQGGFREVEQGLVEPLPQRPAKHRHWNEELARGCIGRKAPAFAATVQNQLSACCQPLGKRLLAGIAPRLLQYIGRAAARAQLPVWRIKR